MQNITATALAIMLHAVPVIGKVVACNLRLMTFISLYLSFLIPHTDLVQVPHKQISTCIYKFPGVNVLLHLIIQWLVCFLLTNGPFSCLLFRHLHVAVAVFPCFPLHVAHAALGQLTRAVLLTIVMRLCQHVLASWPHHWYVCFLVFCFCFWWLYYSNYCNRVEMKIHTAWEVCFAAGVDPGFWKGGGSNHEGLKVSTFWCFLLQSRHFSALLWGLLIQAY